MVHLSPEVKTVPGQDSFWTWAKRVIPKSTFTMPTRMNQDDIILRYSTLGFYPVVGKQVACCWEMYPQMRDLYQFSHFEEEILTKIFDAARYCTYRTVATPYTAPAYQKYGTVDVIPLGVDTDLWRPMNNKESIRKKFGLPLSARIGIWVGTLHHMKGFAKVMEYSAQNPDIHLIIVFGRNNGMVWGAKNASIFADVPHSELAELFNAADFYLCTNRLSAYYMADWEAMACNLPFVNLSEQPPEFVVSSSPRDDVFRHKWDRGSVKRLWFDFFERHGISYK